MAAYIKVAGAGSVAYSLTGEAGNYTLSGSDAGFNYSGATNGGGYDDDKPRKKRWFVEANGKLLVFDSERDALEALNEIEEVAEPVKATRKQRKAVKAEKAQKVAAVEPFALESIDLYAVKQFADLMGRLAEYSAAYNSAQYEQIRAMFAKMQDEEEVEMLLLAQ